MSPGNPNNLNKTSHFRLGNCMKVSLKKLKNPQLKTIFYLTFQLGRGRRILQILHDFKELQNELHRETSLLPKKPSGFPATIPAH
jgi:hypothetical protein